MLRIIYIVRCEEILKEEKKKHEDSDVAETGWDINSVKLRKT